MVYKKCGRKQNASNKDESFLKILFLQDEERKVTLIRTFILLYDYNIKYDI